MQACEELKVFFKTELSQEKKPLATQTSQSNACQLLSLGAY
jgi:hypothetical protein